ncbi:MAG: hypothetical protein GF309_14215 [Candidatus Lokiarchaeota archaeon]|nr:hypothetical protein [Candidatus Lokiarchaeota archaeon]
MSSENAGDLNPKMIEDALGKMTLQGVAAQVKTTLTESFFLVDFVLLLGIQYCNRSTCSKSLSGSAVASSSFISR